MTAVVNCTVDPGRPRHDTASNSIRRRTRFIAMRKEPLERPEDRNGWPSSRIPTETLWHWRRASRPPPHSKRWERMVGAAAQPQPHEGPTREATSDSSSSRFPIEEIHRAVQTSQLPWIASLGRYREELPVFFLERRES